MSDVHTRQQTAGSAGNACQQHSTTCERGGSHIPR
jgi:hypothetical protein